MKKILLIIAILITSISYSQVRTATATYNRIYKVLNDDGDYAVEKEFPAKVFTISSKKIVIGDYVDGVTKMFHDKKDNLLNIFTKEGRIMILCKVEGQQRLYFSINQVFYFIELNNFKL